MNNKLPFLNLGCGNRYIESWINIDYLSGSKSVIQFDLNNGIPLKSNSVEVVYHSHVLEHFTKEKGEEFIKECYRVLRPEGVIRISVPDLEQLAKQYLLNLDRALSDNSELNTENYNWSVLEMFDQMMRNYSGGEMGKYWLKKKLVNEEYLVNRVGYEFKNFRQKYLNVPENEAVQISQKKNIKKSIVERIKTRIKDMISSGKTDNTEYTNIGKFRSSGEVHHWMYDRYSLKMLLERCNFINVEQKDAFHSNLKNWMDYMSLDVENGIVRKPDSLFMEAMK